MNDLTCTIPVLETDRLILVPPQEDHAAVADDMWSEYGGNASCYGRTNLHTARQLDADAGLYLGLLAAAGLWLLGGQGRKAPEVYRRYRLCGFYREMEKTSICTIGSWLECLQSGHTVRAMPVKHWEPY